MASRRDRCPPTPTRAGELRQPQRARAVGGELGAQVGPALVRLAHARDELLDRPLVQRAWCDHHALLLQAAAVGRHRAGHAPADVGVVGAAGGEADQALAGGEDRRYDGDVGQVGAAGERVVEDPRDPWGVILAEHRGHGGRHRAEVHRDVLGLHDHLAGRVEQRGGGVPALLDVRGVGRADQHDAHLFAGCAQRAGDDLELDRVECAHFVPAPGLERPARRVLYNDSHTELRRVGGHQVDGAVLVDLSGPARRDQERGLGQRAQGRPGQEGAGRGLAAEDPRRQGLAVEDDRTHVAGGGRRACHPRAQRRGGPPDRYADVDQLDLGVVVAIAVAQLVRPREGVAQPSGSSPPPPGRGWPRSSPPRLDLLLDGELEGLAAVAQLVANAHARRGARRAPRWPRR